MIYTWNEIKFNCVTTQESCFGVLVVLVGPNLTLKFRKNCVSNSRDLFVVVDVFVLLLLLLFLMMMLFVVGR